MYIGTQFGCRHDTDIQVLAQLGVLHVDQTPAEPVDGVDRGYAEGAARPLRPARHRGGDDPRAAERPLRAGRRGRRHLPRPQRRARPANRAHVRDGTHGRGRGTARHQLQHHPARPPAYGAALRARRRHPVIVRVGQARPVARRVRERCRGRGHHVGADRSLAAPHHAGGPRSTASRWRATPPTPASATACATAAWPACSAWWTDSRS